MARPRAGYPERYPIARVAKTNCGKCLSFDRCAAPDVLVEPCHDEGEDPCRESTVRTFGISCVEPTIGPFVRIDPGQFQFLRQTVLQRPSPAKAGVENTRSERPRACGEYAAICSIPGCFRARPNCVETVLDTGPPASGVKK